MGTLFLFRTLFYTNFETRSCKTKNGCIDALPSFRPYPSVRLSHRLNPKACTSYPTLYTLRPSFRPKQSVPLSHRLSPRAETSYPTLCTLKASFRPTPTVRLRVWGVGWSSPQTRSYELDALHSTPRNQVPGQPFGVGCRVWVGLRLKPHCAPLRCCGDAESISSLEDLRIVVCNIIFVY